MTVYVPDDDELMVAPLPMVVLEPLLAAVEDADAAVVARTVAVDPSGGSVETADAVPPAPGVDVSRADPVAEALAVLEPVGPGIGVNVGNVVGNAAEVGNGLAAGAVLHAASRAAGPTARSNTARATKGINRSRISTTVYKAGTLRRRSPTPPVPRG